MNLEGGGSLTGHDPCLCLPRRRFRPGRRTFSRQRAPRARARRGVVSTRARREREARRNFETRKRTNRSIQRGGEVIAVAVTVTVDVSFIRAGDFAGLFPAPRESRGERVNLDARAPRDARRARENRGKIEGKSSLVDRSSRSLARGRARVNGSTVRVGTRRWTKKCTRGWIWCFFGFFQEGRRGDIDCRRLRAR